MKETTPTEAQGPSGGPAGKEAWLEDLEAIGRRLHEQGLVSLEQVELLDGLARELGRLAREESTATLPVLSLAFSAMEFERIARQQAQAAGTVARVKSAVPLTKEERTILKERLRERFGQEFLLHLEASGLHIHYPGQFAKAGHPRALGYISHMGKAHKGQEVMLTHRIKRDVFNQYDFVMVRGLKGGNDF